MTTVAARRDPVGTAYGRHMVSQMDAPTEPKYYPHRLNFYDTPPQFDVTLEEFEECALDRLRILAEIESCFVRNRTHEETKAIVFSQQKKHLPLNSNTAKNADWDSERRKDHVGHFVLRLAFCRSEELRRRFVKAEMALFRVRYETDDAKEREAFMRSRDFGWTEVPAAECKQLEPLLHACLPYQRDQSKQPEKYYKVPWTRVPDLVEKRRVYLKAGTAYVPETAQSSVVFQQFQSELEKALESTAKALPRMDEDRLTPILDHLSKGFLAGISSEYSSAPENGEAITAEMIDGMAVKHFPLCMRVLHDNLKADSHLKHQGRLQYGLFLKVLGLSIEEAIAFWRKAFSKKYADDKFNKEYLYNIKHSYGLVGKMANYAARSCQTILTQYTPGANESHGCPFRHYSEDSLPSALESKMGIARHDLNDILSSVKTQHYHVACTRVYELTHRVKKGEGLGGGESVGHPNEYAQRSRELEKSRAEAATAEAESTMMVD